MNRRYKEYRDSRDPVYRNYDGTISNSSNNSRLGKGNTKTPSSSSAGTSLSKTSPNKDVVAKSTQGSTRVLSSSSAKTPPNKNEQGLMLSLMDIVCTFILDS